MVKGIGLILVKVFAEMIENLKDKHAKNLADSVMQISVSENKGLYDRLLEEDPHILGIRRGNRYNVKNEISPVDLRKRREHRYAAR